MTTDALVIDVTDATFATEVIERSRTTPVVVDFWAPWCGPCRVLGPVIEQVAGEHRGEVTLAKLNTDENPRTAAQFRIQGIPAVKAFVNGQVAAEFTGALPEPQVRAFFQQIVPSQAEKGAREAARIAQSDPAAAEQKYRELLASEPRNADVIVGLAELLLTRGAADEADELLERVASDRRAKVLKHRLFLDRFARDHAAEDIPGEVAANPGDPRARYRHGVLLAARGDYEQALEELLESVRLDRTFADGAARKAMLAVFEIVGLTPMTREFQQRLSAVLF